MPSSLEYRDKERQRKRESRRQESQAQQYLAFLHMSNALLVTAVHVKMKNTSEL